MNKNVFVSIIIANYNGKEFLDSCLRSVLRSSYKNFELVLIDDGSTDDSLKKIRKFQEKDKRVLLIRNKTNLGAAASRNKAIKFARGEIIVFLDNDTEVRPDSVSEIIKPLLNRNFVGSSQAVLLDFNRRDSVQMAGGLLIPQTGWLVPFNQWRRFSKIRNKLKEKNIVAISAALAVKKEVIDKVGGFDEKESIYTEDLDFCWRIWVAGYRIVLAPRSIVFHWTKSVEKRSGMKANYKQIYFHLAKNSFTSIIKNYELVNVFKYLPFSISINIGRGFLFLFTRRTFDALAGSLRGLVWLFNNLSDVAKARKNIQAGRKFSDEYLMKKIFTKENLIRVYNKYFR